jgi:hypothetical protein
MKVLFGYSSDFSKITAVCWQAENGEVVERVLRIDGTTKDYVHPSDSIDHLWNKMGAVMDLMYPAEVDDIRTAMMYLGKSSDLVELLPRATFDAVKQSEPESEQE